MSKKYNLTHLFYFLDLEETTSDLDTQLTATEENIPGIFTLQ